jgi:hypothetical protein
MSHWRYLWSAIMNVGVCAEREAGNVTVDSGVFHPEPALVPVLFAIFLKRAEEQFRFHGQCLSTLYVISQQPLFVFASHL